MSSTLAHAEPHPAGGAPSPAYRAPWWLPGGHLQTVYSTTLAPRQAVSYRRERWDTTPNGVADGDFIDVDVVTPTQDTVSQAGEATARATGLKPTLVLFHGLEGSSQSPYALALMRMCLVRGWNGMVVHFRGCSGEINRLPRAYHSGDATEIDWVLRKAKARIGAAPLYAAGVSLGGNALMKWLGERGSDAATLVRAAAAVSAPLDLMASGDALGRGVNLFYAKHFLATMKRKSLMKLQQHPGIFDAAAVARSHTLREFDNIVTAPLHGYRDTDDYWTRASSKPGLVFVQVPTLLINALNDPFLPAQALPTRQQVSSWIHLDFPQQGGHVGFSSPRFPGRAEWLPERIFHFFEHGS
jgi:uncharacterized protein